MRITGYRMIDLSAAGTANAQSAVADASAEVTSGLRVTKPSDDPVAWTAAQRAKVRKTLAEGATGAVKISRDQIQQTDGALGTLSDLLSQVRTLAVQGANGTYDANARTGLAAQVHGLFLSAIAAANTQSPGGEYLLAGGQSLAAPFAPDGTYNGDAAARSVATDQSSTAIATIPGSRLTAAFGVDVLPLLDKVATALAANDLPSLQASIGDLDTAVKQVALTRTVTGGAMSVLDATVAAHAQLATNLQTQISSDVEVDMVAAATGLAKASSTLDASRTVSAHLIQLLQQNGG
jgi:flagellar hook-associated protein 3 FlgL